MQRFGFRRGNGRQPSPVIREDIVRPGPPESVPEQVAETEETVQEIVAETQAVEQEIAAVEENVAAMAQAQTAERDLLQQIDAVLKQVQQELTASRNKAAANPAGGASAPAWAPA